MLVFEYFFETHHINPMYAEMVTQHFAAQLFSTPGGLTHENNIGVRGIGTNY